ncbi:MAG: hypothetical protein ABF856_05225 [Acetobacter aceti]
MTEKSEMEDKINKLIVLASTQSVIITELASIVLRLQSQTARRDGSPFGAYLQFSPLKEELKQMSEQLDALVEPSPDAE